MPATRTKPISRCAMIPGSVSIPYTPSPKKYGSNHPPNASPGRAISRFLVPMLNVVLLYWSWNSGLGWNSPKYAKLVLGGIPSHVCRVMLMAILQSENSASIGRRVRSGISRRRPKRASTRVATSSNSILPFRSASMASSCSGSRLALLADRGRRGTYS